MQDLEELKRQGLSIRAISRLTGCDRKTISRYLRTPEGRPTYGPRPAQPGKLERFKPYLEERLKAGVWNAQVLLRELRTQGYRGGYTILKDWLHPQREAATMVAVRRFETPPGRQAQVDWGHLGSLEMNGRERPLNGFAFTLGYSRAMMAEAALDQKLGTQLFLPNVGINPEHPFWVPEFVGDTIVVNGKVWPFLSVAPKRYRFYIINGSNARTYELFLVNPVTKAMGPPIWQIATDGGYLDAPVKIDPNIKPLDKLVIMPGERADFIIDFAGLQGQTLILRNTGRGPYPKGTPPNGLTVGQILQIRVNQPFAGPDASYNPASGIPLRPPMVRLVNPAAGTLAAGVTVSKTRQLTLNEIGGPGRALGGPCQQHNLERP